MKNTPQTSPLNCFYDRMDCIVLSYGVRGSHVDSENHRWWWWFVQWYIFDHYYPHQRMKHWHRKPKQNFFCHSTGPIKFCPSIQCNGYCPLLHKSQSLLNTKNSFPFPFRKFNTLEDRIIRRVNTADGDWKFEISTKARKSANVQSAGFVVMACDATVVVRLTKPT